MRIGVDLMGGDTPPAILFNGVLQAAENLDSSFGLVVIATKTVVDQLAPLVHSLQEFTNKAKIYFHIVAESIAMADDPIKAVRKKKEASLVVGIRLLKKKQIDAFVSCGNTGALIASAAFALPMLPGIKRPGLLAQIPTEKGVVCVIDVGGNIAPKAHHLVQFAYLGAAYQKALFGVESPKVGLLNIGSESVKGTAEVRQAYESLQKCSMDAQCGFTFLGNIEGRDVFKGDIDVLATDGFTGNVLLKTAEGVASFIFSSLKKTIDKEKDAASYGIFSLQKQFNYAEYPGAIICGVEGIVIKVHGSGSEKALYSSIIGAANCIKKRMIPRIHEQLLNLEQHS